MTSRAQYELVLDNFNSMSLPARLGNTVFEAGREMAKPSAERAAPYRDEALAAARKGAAATFANFHEPAEKLFLRKILTLAAGLPRDQRIAPVDERLRGDFSEPEHRAVRGRGVCRDDVEDRRRLYRGTGQEPGGAGRPE